MSILLWSALVAAQQDYPNKLIHFITPYPPGGATTPLAHFIGQKMNESWGQPVLIENRPGGNTIVGSDALAKSALISGRVQMFLATTNTSIPQIRAGRVKAIAIASDARLPALPQVPTFIEAGLPGFDVGTWYGILAPAGTPKLIIDKIATEIGRYLAMPEFKELLVGQGMTPFYSNAERLAALLIADQARFMNIVKSANIKFEN